MELDCINLYEEPKYDNDSIFKIIKYILHDKEYEGLIMYYNILDMIMHISDRNLFNYSKSLFEDLWFYKKVIESKTPALYGTSAEIYDSITDEKIKLKLDVSIFSIALLKELYTIFLINSEVPILIFEIDNYTLKHNLKEIEHFIRKKSISESQNDILNLPTKAEQESEIKKMLLSWSTIDFKYDSDAFKNEIKHFKNLLEFLPEPTTGPTPKHDEVFCNNGFELFDYLLIKHIRSKGTRGRFSDIADYYWKMYNNEPKYIHQRPEEFKNWFYRMYDKEDIGKIHTKEKIKNIHRDKHFSDALEWFKNKNK